MPSIARTLDAAAVRLRAAGVGDARLEADLLLAHALGIGRAALLARLRDDLADAAAYTFDALLARRLRREPLAYITGVREFFGIEIACGPGVLVPRPETELLVEIAVAEAARRGGVVRIADVGTGSGAIAIAIALASPAARITAIDASTEALAVARGNVERFGLAGRVELRRGDLLEGTGAFDVIVANLPYVSEAEWSGLEPEVREWEPRDALVAGPTGTEAIGRLLASAPPHLAAGGVLAVEIGATQAAALTKGVEAHFPDASACVIKDLAGLDRVVVVRRGEEDG